MKPLMEQVMALQQKAAAHNQTLRRPTLMASLIER